MNKIFRRTSSIKLPLRGRESQNEENGRAHKGVTECPLCHNVNFKKKWSTSLLEIEKISKKKLTISRKEICPACKEIKEHLFAGELFVEKFPERCKIELLNLIHNFGETAIEIDPQDRIIKIEENTIGYRILTSENQLVNRLAKKIKEAFKNVEVKISHSQEPFRVNRVHAIYQGE